MKFAYVVLDFHADGQEIVKIFSTSDQAYEFVKRKHAKQYERLDVEIHELAEPETKKGT